MGINVIPDAEPLDQKVSDRRVWTFGFGSGASIEVDSVIDQLPIVLGLGIGETKGGIYIAIACAISVASLLIGQAMFRRFERSFAQDL